LNLETGELKFKASGSEVIPMKVAKDTPTSVPFNDLPPGATFFFASHLWIKVIGYGGVAAARVNCKGTLWNCAVVGKVVTPVDFKMELVEDY